MNTKLNRRRLFALGGLGALAAGTGIHGPEIDPDLPGALVLRVRKNYKTWVVCVPDYETAWTPGVMMPPVKWVPLEEFLAELDTLQREMI